MAVVPTEGVASTREIRSRFPALERVHAGRPVAYFDAPGGTQVPRAVVDAMAGYLLRHNANTHWHYASSEETDAMLAAARRAFGDFVGGEPEGIAFGPSMTSLTFHLGRALGRGWGPGDEILATELEHHANLDTWRALERERGVSVRVARMDPASGELDWADFESKLGPRTALVAIGAASNALGTITDVARAVRLAHDAGALGFVDAVHYAPHRLPDVAATGCDFLVCSPYKFYGPHLGVLWGRPELVESLDVPRLQPAPDRTAERLETGTQNHEGIAGAAAAVHFLAALAGGPGGAGAGDGAGAGGAGDSGGDGAGQGRRGRLAATMAALQLRGDALFARLWAGLAGLDGVRLYGPPPGRPRTPTLGFTVAGVDPGDVARRLAGLGVFVSHGDFYAVTVIDRLGVRERGGLVRAGCACYTTEEEVDRLVGGVADVARRAAGT